MLKKNLIIYKTSFNIYSKYKIKFTINLKTIFLIIQLS